MEKFTRTLRGYNPEEVNDFIDKVIKKVEKMVSDIEERDKQIAERDHVIEELTKKIRETERLSDEIKHYRELETNLKKAILVAQNASEQLRKSAREESDMIVSEAKRNANRIVNEALLKAEKTEFEADMLRRNIIIFKRRLKDIIESQLVIVDDIDKLEL